MSSIKIIDLHCDALSKLLVYAQEHFIVSNVIDVTLEQLTQANYGLQVFAIYVPDKFPKTIDTLMKMIDLFYSKVLLYPQLYWVKSKADLIDCFNQQKIGVMLSIEGVECLEAKLYMSSIINKLGIAAIGLTWNRLNWAGEGVLAETNSGLSQLGKQFINKMALHHTIMDVSHLSLKSFDDLLTHYDGPIWASHSNCYSIFAHPRNLNDEQIKTLIARKGIIGVTYVPQFISDSASVTISDLMKHIDHLIELGGVNHLALGSDFDGIDDYVEGLRQPTDVKQLITRISENYGDSVAEKIAWKNAYSYLLNHLK